MATSLQRLFVMTLAVYLMIFFTAQISNRANLSILEEYLGKSVNSNQNFSSDFMSKYTSTTTDTNKMYLEQSPADQKYGGKSIIELIKNGFGFYSSPPGAEPVEALFQTILNWVLGLLYVILVLEGFMILYGKKVT